MVEDARFGFSGVPNCNPGRKRPRLKSNRLLILACSQRKRPDEGRIAAIERYNGPLWQSLRAVDPTGSLAQVAFLSARYGLQDARFAELPAYDCQMTDAIASAMIAGGIETRWPRPENKHHRGAPAGIHPAAEVSSMAYAAGSGFKEVALAGGHRYIRVLQAWLPELIDGGWVLGDARISVVNGPIGLMRQQLRAWLLDGGRAES
jgi:hypothetical protein